MNLIEFIGFIITMVAMTFLILRRVWEDRRRRAHPEEYSNKKEQQEATLKQFLKSLDIDMDEEDEEGEIERHIPPKPPQPIPKPAVRQQQKMKRSNEFSSPKYTIPVVQNMAEGYHAIVKSEPSQASRMIDQLPSKKQMIVYQEIMNPPVSLR